MKEYIIIDDFLDELTKKFASAQGHLKELIRCKDCIYYNGAGIWCDDEQVVYDEDFCSKAVRKENDWLGMGSGQRHR